jgi:P-type conjugative transfer protein TrbJ
MTRYQRNITMNKKLFGAIALAMALSFAPLQPTSAQVTVFDPANYAKNTLTELNTLQTTINQATQISNQLQQLAYQLESLRNIPNGTWGEIKADLAALRRIAKVGQSISYADANLSSEFTQMYPGYEVPTNYTRAYTQWGTNSLGGMQGALSVAGLQSSQLSSEDATFAQLEALSDGSVGHMEALQVGNMIGIQQAQQLQKLRELQMAQLQGQFDYLATQQQNDLTTFATLRAWLDSQTNYKSSE